MRQRALCSCVFAAALFCVAHANAQPGSSNLPLRSVRLYETGVGYFERSGTMPAGTTVGLPVPAGHLDDALKTLVVLGADGTTTVSGIEFASSVTQDRARALAGLPPGGTGALDYRQLLGSLKGAAVEVRATGQSVRGRLVDVLDAEHSDVEDCTAKTVPSASEAPQDFTPTCTADRHMTLLVLTDKSEVRRFRSADVLSVRPTEASVASRLAAGVDTMSSRGSQARRVLGLLGSSVGPVALGYVAETPVWRSTYRMVLDRAGTRGALQGWALLHNDTDEDWKHVRVELVNGRPTSFLFPLAAPRYARRKMVTPDEQLSTIPQLQDTTVDNMWRGESDEEYGSGGLGLSGVGEGGGGRGEGIGLGMVGTLGHGAGTGSGNGSSSVLSVGSLASIAPADTVETGALFRYALKNPIDLRAHGSALVPFAQRNIQAKRIALFERAGTTAKSAIHFKNDTPQTLPAGTIAVFEDGGFSGESALNRLKPKESQIVAFGLDLDVELTVRAKRAEDSTRLVFAEDDHLVEHFIRHHRIRYELANRNGSARTVYLGLDYVNNASVKGADSLAWDETHQKANAVFEVAGGKERMVDLEVEEGLTKTHAIKSITAKQLEKLARKLGGDGAKGTGAVRTAHTRAILLDASHALRKADACNAEITRRHWRLMQVNKDLPRLRTNLAAVAKTSEEAAEKFVARLVESETEVQQIRSRVATLHKWAKGHRAHAKSLLAKLK